MICKKCGAYNPDHATFCKVCAANLKDQTEADDAAQVNEVEEVAEKEYRPRRGTVKAPDFSAARRAAGFKAAQKAEEPVSKEDEDADEDLDEEEVKPASKAPRFSRPAAAPAKKRRIVDEDEDEDDEAEDEYDEKEDVKPAAKTHLFSRPAPAKKRAAVEEEDDDDEEEEGDGEAEKLESEPKTTRFTRTSRKKRPVVEEDDDDEDDDEDEDDDFDDDDDEDEGYEEYEPTPPRRKKTGRSQNKNDGGGFNIIALLIACLAAILLIIVGIIAFCNIKGGSTKNKLPSFLQFNCAGKASPEKTVQPQQQTIVPPADNQSAQNSEPTDAPVTGTSVDYSATKLEEIIDAEGRPCISISMVARPGDTVTIVLPHQDDYVVENKEATDQPYLMTIFKSCYYPNVPLEDPVYTVTPEILVTHADGTKESLHVDSFDITFPTVQLELLEPAQASIPEEGIMAAEGNVLVLKGRVDDHTVAVTVNGQPVTNMYTGGNFDFTYAMTGDEPETITIEASKADYVPTSYSFTVKPYVFIPEQMTLEVESNINKLKADKSGKVTVTGTTAPGATLTAAPAAEYQSSVVCGAPNVDAEGHFTFDVTFDKSYYGIASITLHAKKDGYEEGETNCLVARMYGDQKAAVKGYSKTKSYHEVYGKYKFEDVMANPSAAGLFRFSGSVVEVDPETGVVTIEAKTSAKEKTKIYVFNASDKWEPDKHVGTSYLLYCTLNGLYTDGTSLYATAWFVKK